MPWVYIGTSKLKCAYVWTTPVKCIYVGTTKVRPTNPIVEFLLVAWGWGWGWTCVYAWGWGGGWGIIYCSSYEVDWNKCVVIGSWGTSASQTNGTNWGNSCFGTIVACGWGWGGRGCSNGLSGWSGWGWGWTCRTWGGRVSWQGNCWGKGCAQTAWGWGWYSTAGSTPWSNYNGGAGGNGLCSNITGTYCRYWGWGWGWGCVGNWASGCGGGMGATRRNNGCNAPCYWGWGGGAGYSDHSSTSNQCKWGNGCQGILIVRYPSSCWYSITWGTKSSVTISGTVYCLHRFTSNWTLTVS